MTYGIDRPATRADAGAPARTTRGARRRAAARWWLGALVGAATLVVSGSTAWAQSSWLGGAGSPGLVTPASQGEAYVGLWLDVPESAVPPGTHLPMALSLVIDTSGSMRGGKIRHAREAALRFLDTLHPGDIVSIYAFNTTVTEVVPPTTMGPGVREQLQPRVQALAADGDTNLHGGLERGLAAVHSAPATHRIRRVVLISDGIATVGPRTPDALGGLAADGARRRIAVAAIGVGADYDDQTLRVLAVRSAGRLYHVDGAEGLTQVVSEEVSLLDHSAATDTRVDVVPAPGVSIASVETLGGQLESGRASFNIGTMFAPQRREYLLRVRVPTSQVGRHPLAHVTLRYRGLDAQATERREDVVLSYEVTADSLAAQASESPRVTALVALQEAATDQLAAADTVGRGDRAGADQRLARAQQRLRAAAARSRDASMRARLQQEQVAIERRRTEVRAAAAPPAQRSAARRTGSAAMDAMGY